MIEKAVGALVGTVVGAILGFLGSRIAAKRATFRCTRSVEAFSKAGNPVVGYGLTLQWQSASLENFAITRFHVENSSSKDFTEVVVRLWTGQNTVILQESASHLDSLDAIGYAPGFVAQIQPDASGEYSESQIALFNHRRELIVPVWNRYDGIEIVCLSSNPTAGTEGNVWLEINQPGVRVVDFSQSEGRLRYLGVDVAYIWRSLIAVSVLSIALPIVILDNKIAVGLSVGLLGGLSGYIAASLYHLGIKLRKVISN